MALNFFTGMNNEAYAIRSFIDSGNVMTSPLSIVVNRRLIAPLD